MIVALLGYVGDCGCAMCCKHRTKWAWLVYRLVQMDVLHTPNGSVSSHAGAFANNFN